MKSLYLVLQLTCLVGCHSFASYFLTDEFCERTLEPGTIIMNNIAALSKDRHIRVHRLDSNDVLKPVESGSAFISGETLQIGISDLSDEFVFEASNGAFEVGGCDGKRSTIGGKLKILSDVEDVVIVAGWASGHGVVSLTEPFRLIAPGRASDASSQTPNRNEISKHFAKPINVNAPTEHKTESELKLNKISKKFLRGQNINYNGAVKFDQLWRQYVDSEGFLEQYLTDELVNVLLIITILLSAYTFYRVCRSRKQVGKKN